VCRGNAAFPRLCSMAFRLMIVLAALPSPSQASSSLVAPPAPGRFKLALLQLAVGTEKSANLHSAEAAIREAANAGAQMVVLPECFNSPYSVKAFPEYAEPVPTGSTPVSSTVHPSTHMLSRVAAELRVFIIGGSIPERDESTAKLYNTAIAVGPDGSIVATHRKIHLFDIDIPGKITFRESDVLSSPQPATPSLFDTPWGRIGLGICYDIRFPQYAALLREAGAHVLIYPGAFNLVTGPQHWELLARARAVDNQVFVAVASPARNADPSGYQAWGHSSLVSPWGKVVATTEDAPAIVYADVDVAEVEQPRGAIPVSEQKRDDLYSLRWIAPTGAGAGAGRSATIASSIPLYWRRARRWLAERVLRR
jgi:omega-amidase